MYTTKPPMGRTACRDIQCLYCTAKIYSANCPHSLYRASVPVRKSLTSTPPRGRVQFRGGFSPGEVRISSRIKVPPPFPRSRDFLPSGRRFEIEQCCLLCWGKHFPLWSENFPPCGKKWRSCCGLCSKSGLSRSECKRNKWIIIIFKMNGFRGLGKNSSSRHLIGCPRAVL